MTWEIRGILAGRGSYPALLADRLLARGVDVVVAGIAGQFQAELPSGVGSVSEFPLGALERTARFFRENRAEKIYLAGGVHRLRGLISLRPDRKALSLLPRALARGDNALLSAVAERFKELGLSVCDPSALVEDLFADQGPLAGPVPGAAVLRDMEVARRAAAGLGRADKGQGALVKDGSVLGREDSRGTDALLCRKAVTGAVLVKVVKPGQDRRFDMPAVGPSTLLIARAKKMAAIGVEAGGVMLLHRGRVEALAGEAGISLFGLPRPAHLANQTKRS